MVIGRTTFFLVLFIIATIPFFLHKLLWIASSEKTTGVASFNGMEYAGQIVRNYSIIKFMAGKDKVYFNTNDNIFFKRGEVVPLRYQKADPSDARVDFFVSMWGDTLVYGGIMIVILAILMLHPSVVPYRSGVKLMGRRPFIQIVYTEQPA